MKKAVLSIIFLGLYFFPQQIFAQIQQDLDKYNKERIQINKTGMSVLTGWSLANMAAGGIGYFTAKEGEAKYFHQMNGMWGAINIIFGATGLVQAMRDNKTYDFEKTLKQQKSIEKILLFNAALDLVYVSAGFYLLENAKLQHINGNNKKRDTHRGWGNSVILQGGFLCLFDAAMFIVHNRHANKKLAPILKRATFTVNENGVGLNYRF